MMVRTTMNPVNGMALRGRRAAATTGGSIGVASPLERLIQIMRRNEPLLERLETLSARLAKARGYADDPLSNPAFAEALVDHSRRKVKEVLAQLRTNRAEALGILRTCGGRDATRRN